MNTRLSEKWIKASIAGTIWAASEIVLGSFLHNLRIPFSGNILTGIGIIILISISYIWTEKGLFWRAGLICAILKTMSPSAVIFGPMVAIFSESLLLEISVIIFGRNLAGFFIGAMLAMSWNLFQKILNFIIFYGSNIIEIYTNLLKMAQKQLNIHTDIVWMPILILLVIYALCGLLAAVIGIKTGRRMLKQPVYYANGNVSRSPDSFNSFSKSNFNYSVTWLFINVFLLIGSFVILNLTSWYLWGPVIIITVVIWSLKYKRALRQISKPGFWIFFVVITLLTAFFLTDASAGENLFRKGLLTGIQMNFRAVVIIVGFSVIGTELYNPVVRNFFTGTSFRNLPLAIELSVESLPDFIASIPELKSIVKNPVSIFYQVLSHAEGRLSEIKKKNNNSRKVIIITGSIREGKTSFAKMLIGLFRSHNISAGGIISERISDKESTVGYDLVNIETGERTVFLRLDGECGPDRIGRFSICQDGIKTGNNILNSLIVKKNKVIIIDEVGLLELNGKGWAGSINSIIGISGINLVITVRSTFINDVINKWNLGDPLVFNISEIDWNKTGEEIADLILKEGIN